MDPAVYDRMAAHEDRHWWFVARRQIVADVIAKLESTSILDGLSPEISGWYRQRREDLAGA